MAQWSYCYITELCQYLWKITGNFPLGKLSTSESFRKVYIIKYAQGAFHDGRLGEGQWANAVGWCQSDRRPTVIHFPSIHFSYMGVSQSVLSSSSIDRISRSVLEVPMGRVAGLPVLKADRLQSQNDQVRGIFDPFLPYSSNSQRNFGTEINSLYSSSIHD